MEWLPVVEVVVVVVVVVAVVDVCDGGVEPPFGAAALGVALVRARGEYLPRYTNLSCSCCTAVFVAMISCESCSWHIA